AVVIDHGLVAAAVAPGIPVFGNLVGFDIHLDERVVEPPGTPYRISGPRTRTGLANGVLVRRSTPVMDAAAKQVEDSLVVAGEEFCVGILGFRNLDGDGLARNVAVGLGQDVERMLGPPPVAVSVPGHSVGGLQACFGWGLGVFIARPLTGSWIEQEGTVPAATPDSPLAL